MIGKWFTTARSWEISSNDDVEKAAARSRKWRAPLRHHQAVGKVPEDRTRPHFVDRAVELTNKFFAQYFFWQKRWEEAVIAAAATPRPGLFLILMFLLPAFDALIIEPLVSNSIDTDEDMKIRVTIGLTVSYIFAAGGAAIGHGIRSILPPKAQSIVPIFFNVILGAICGFLLGLYGEGEAAAIVLRTIVMGAIFAVMTYLEEFWVKGRKAWNPVKEAKRMKNHFWRIANAWLKKVNRYEDKTIDATQKFNGDEVTREEGLVVGAFAHRVQGYRMEYVWRRVSRWFDDFFKIALLAVVTATSANDAFADSQHVASQIVVFDVTSSVTDKEDLQRRLLENLPIKYGSNIEAYALSCDGLTFIYSGKVLRRSKAGHRQSLTKVKDELAAALQKAKESSSGACSPLADSLLTLAIDLGLRVNQGEKVMLIVASDFLDTTRRKVRVNIYPSHARGSRSSGAAKKAETTGEPFKGVEVLVVFPSAKGKNPKEREQAVALAKNLFAGAASLRFAY